MKPLLLDVPQELTSERLILRVPRAGDGKLIIASVRESLPELKMWMPWAKEDYSVDDAEEWCRQSAGDFMARKQLPFAIFARPDGRHLGIIGAFAFGWEVPKCEIGYWLRKDDAGRGYMTEAIGAIVGILRQTLHMRRIEMRIDARNLRSRKIAERCGTQLEGILRRDALNPDGTVRDTCVYSLIYDADQELLVG